MQNWHVNIGKALIDMPVGPGRIYPPKYLFV